MRARVGELADALGVGRNVPALWAKQGAPGGPPFDELAWRVWAAARGHVCKRDPEPELLAELAAAGVAPYRRQVSAGGAAAAAPPIDAPQPEVRVVELEAMLDYDKLLGAPKDWQDAGKREAMRTEMLKSHAARIELEVRRGQLLTPEQVALREQDYDQAILAELAGLPEFAGTLVVPELADDARRRAQAWLDGVRERVARRLAVARPEASKP